LPPFPLLCALSLVPTPCQIEKVVLVLTEELETAQGDPGITLFKPPLLVRLYDMPEHGAILRPAPVAGPEDVVEGIAVRDLLVEREAESQFNGEVQFLRHAEGLRGGGVRAAERGDKTESEERFHGQGVQGQELRRGSANEFRAASSRGRDGRSGVPYGNAGPLLLRASAGPHAGAH